MTDTRQKVLRTLLAHPRATIHDLADAVGINPISVRHHINALLADQLVTSEEERHGVGRPRRVYFLTETGIEQFPTRYIRLTIRLLEQLKGAMPEHMVAKLFEQMAQGMADDYARKPELQKMNLEERLNLMQTLLGEEGFVIQWERQGDQYHIHETSCPYYHVGQDHPEICSVDRILISTVLSVPAAKTQCILNGDHFCTYVIPAPEKEEAK